MKANEAPEKIYVYIPDDDIVGTASTQVAHKNNDLDEYIKKHSDNIYYDEDGKPIEKDLMAFALSVSFDMIPASANKSYHDLNRIRILDAVIKGARWKEKQMMQNAVERSVKEDAGGYPYISQIELYDYDKDVPLAKEGDKYKVVLIKEE